MTPHIRHIKHILKRLSIKNTRRGFAVFNPWLVWSALGALLVAIPLMIIFYSTTITGDEIWRYILINLLPTYLLNTIILMLAVGLFTFILGVSTAWMVSIYDFPGERWLRWALVLPIAIPAYISGFTWVGILDYASPIYVFFRNNLGIETGQFLFFNILSLPGAVLILSLAFYPYVYLIARASFSGQSANYAEVSFSLGKSTFTTFCKVGLPLARPSIVAGVSLALMEVLNDYGVAYYFGVDTFTTGIFTAWFSFSNPTAALKLSAYLMIFVLALIMMEKYQRRKMRYDMIGSQYRPIVKKKLSGGKAIFAFLICLLPLLFGFLFPVAMLVYWASQTMHIVTDFRFWPLLGNSFLLAGIASGVVVVLALLIVYTVRTFPSGFVKLLSKIATLGYALPGAVVAIGIITATLWLDSTLGVYSTWGGKITITGTWLILIYAYMVRFMAVGYNGIESGMQNISLSMDEASRSMGMGILKTFIKINLPLLKGPITGAALLVFIDVLKELPLTLILRPFNFDTLAIRAFEFASDERIAEAAPASLIIVITSLIPVLFLNQLLSNHRKKSIL